MRKILSMLLCVLLLLCMTCAAQADVTVADITATPWKNFHGAMIEFKADGTGVTTAVNGYQSTLTWSLDGNVINYHYDSYSYFSYSFTFTQENGGNVLLANTGEYWYPLAVYEKMYAEYADKPYTPVIVNWNEPVTTDMLEFTLNGCLIESRISTGSGVVLMPDRSGEVVLCLTGPVENIGMDNARLNRILAECIIDGKSYVVNDFYVTIDSGLVNNLDALYDGTFYIGISVPEDVAMNFTTATLRFAVRDEMVSIPMNYGHADQVYEMELSGDVLRAAVPEREITYFEEVSTLPTPDNFVDVYQSGSSVSRSNGKITRCRYTFSSMDASASMSSMLKEYVDALKEQGFSISGSSSEYTISKDGKKLATAKVENNKIVVNLIP